MSAKDFDLHALHPSSCPFLTPFVSPFFSLSLMFLFLSGKAFDDLMKENGPQKVYIDIDS